ncbi:hypothetical protein FNV43_RR22508 [Rhamnella rubrinervis]|uniref:Uncharacterized protein n=1 Tax=Rhamnella rubrinervis TaxID=2594499 RepID=A0A8K0DWB2_9ROSA|nr:hypothetical protein FNV43_RR22508 [Rhamnella rubrinervis]
MHPLLKIVGVDLDADRVHSLRIKIKQYKKIDAERETTCIKTSPSPIASPNQCGMPMHRCIHHQHSTKLDGTPTGFDEVGVQDIGVGDAMGVRSKDDHAVTI